MILHLEKMDQFRHSSALLDHLLKVEVRVGDELFNGLLVCEHAILIRLLVLEDT